MHFFAHNGHLGDAIPTEDVRRQRFQPAGETYSEAAFCLFMERFSESIDPETSDVSDRTLKRALCEGRFLPGWLLVLRLLLLRQ
jgi:predicted glutamine amidotransferase